MGADTAIWEKYSLPSAPPVVATATAKQKDQYDDHDDQRGSVHDFSLPFGTFSELVNRRPIREVHLLPGSETARRMGISFLTWAEDSAVRGAVKLLAEFRTGSDGVGRLLPFLDARA